jgi:hypothetical protein
VNDAGVIDLGSHTSYHGNAFYVRVLARTRR